MKYQTYSFSEKETVYKLLDTKNKEGIISALIGAVNGINDWKWLQDLCLKYINNDDFWIAKTAISCLGDIARIHNSLDIEKVKIELSKINRDELKGPIENVFEDINIFIK